MDIKLFGLTFNNAAADIRIVPVDYDKYEVAYHYDENHTPVRCAMNDDCPICHGDSKIPSHTWIAIPFYVESERCVKYWIRSRFGRRYLDNLYHNTNGHPENYRFKIIRHGDKFDKLTTYEFINLGEANPKTVEYELANPEAIFEQLFTRAEEIE